MSLRVLGSTVVGLPLTLTRQESHGLIIQPFAKNPQETEQAIEVLFVGPLCKEVKPGQQVILAPYQGYTVSLLDDDDEVQEYIAVGEEHINLIIE